MSKSLENKAKPIMVLELVPHPEGQWEINERPYRPEWPIAGKGDYDEQMELAKIMIETARVASDPGLQEVYYPKLIRVELYEGNRMKVLVDGEDRTSRISN